MQKFINFNEKKNIKIRQKRYLKFYLYEKKKTTTKQVKKNTHTKGKKKAPEVNKVTLNNVVMKTGKYSYKSEVKNDFQRML